VAACAVSGTAAIPPFTIVMQSGGSLVGICAEPQPVWKPTLMGPFAFPTMLYIAVNRSPVVGGLLSRLEAAAKWMVSIVSVETHVFPWTSLPPMHLTRIVGMP
jgi:hypothetical protein